jgi:hypothetical protein
MCMSTIDAEIINNGVRMRLRDDERFLIGRFGSRISFAALPTVSSPLIHFEKTTTMTRRATNL